MAAGIGERGVVPRTEPLLAGTHPPAGISHASRMHAPTPTPPRLPPLTLQQRLLVAHTPAGLATARNVNDEVTLVLR